MRARVLAAGAIAVALALAGAGRAHAASQALVLPGDDGDLILTVTEDEAGGRAQLTLICSSRTDQFGIVLAAPGPGVPPASAELSLRADGAAIGPLTFDRQGSNLILIGEGGPGRANLGKLAHAGVIEIDENSRKLRFVLSGAARYREQCRL